MFESKIEITRLTGHVEIYIRRGSCWPLYRSDFRPDSCPDLYEPYSISFS